MDDERARAAVRRVFEERVMLRDAEVVRRQIESGLCVRMRGPQAVLRRASPPVGLVPRAIECGPGAGIHHC